jgi:glycerol uptake facilitator-like aquaporin
LNLASHLVAITFFDGAPAGVPHAYWFTASTSFANPAVTVARAFTDTFAGIRLVDVPMFIVAQFAGVRRLLGCSSG